MDENPPIPGETTTPDAGLLAAIENLKALLASMQDWRAPWALRERLPDRRHSETADLWYRDKRYHLTIGEFADGRPGEVFIHGAKPGSDTDLLCDDIGVLISRLLQHGDTPDALAAGLGKLGNGQGPASLIGAVAASLVGRTGDKGNDPYTHRYPCRA